MQPGPVDTDMNPGKGAFLAFLAGPEAGYITGASLDIDGGFGA